MLKLLTAVAFTLCLATASAQAQPAAQQPVGIEDAAWLAGRWIGEGLGGQIEETWAPPIGGQMVGHFRLTREGKPVFYEIELIDEHEGGLRFRVKHFNPDFTGWEERDAWVSFAFESASSVDLRYRGLTLRRVGVDRMEITIRIRHPDGRVVDEVLRLRRAPL
jgi:hypothetical protein